jgi:arylsulfatase A-like enzyme
MTDRPNLLFVFVDQLAARWTGPGGSDDVHTPVLDRFVGDGVSFDRAYSNTPVCTPYRSMLFTGQYPSQTGVRDNGQALPDGVPTLAECFHDGGYHPCYVGKWHLSGEPQEERWVPPGDRGGFRDFVGWESHHVDHMDGRIWADDPDDPIEMPGHETDALTDIAVDRLESLAGDADEQPFSMFVSYQAPHPPCTPLSPHVDPYDDRDLVSDPPNTDPDARYRNWGLDIGVQEFRRRYYAEVTQLDHAFGRLLDTLDEAGLAEDTVAVFTSDHGEMNGCHGRFDKFVFYEESIGVPLAVRGPGVPEDETVAEPVSAIDLFPTLVDLCGLSPPRSVEGESFADAVRGEATPDPAAPQFFECDDWVGVLRGQQKLLADREDCAPRALYDLDHDPWERENLLAETDEAAVRPLHDRLRQWHERVVAPAGE